MSWHTKTNKREMPWKGVKDPYKIWLSEVILQQTRVEQGWSYYENFIKKHPTIQQLAKAKDEDVFKLWEGLGYYNRCKNLLFTARFISKELKGIFPEKYDEILLLKGIGPYTAAAISSFAFNLPFAVVDGNVFRVLSRVFGIETAIDSTEGKKEFTQLAEKVLDKKNPGEFNQAIMDFGATVCKPIAPLCSSCNMQKICVAFNEGKVNQLPFKEKVLQKKHRWFYYFLMEHNEKILVHKRTQKDIWENLFEFYLLESTEQMKWNKVAVHQWLKEQFALQNAAVVHISEVSVQQLTHQQIKGQFIKVKLKKIPKSLEHYQWQAIDKIKLLAFPKFINQYLSQGEK
jgi:A/G-specific adenine glycosylase